MGESESMSWRTRSRCQYAAWEICLALVHVQIVHNGGVHGHVTCLNPLTRKERDRLRQVDP
jgi:hypothetical protein